MGFDFRIPTFTISILLTRPPKYENGVKFYLWQKICFINLNSNVKLTLSIPKYVENNMKNIKNTKNR